MALSKPTFINHLKLLLHTHHHHHPLRPATTTLRHLSFATPEDAAAERRRRKRRLRIEPPLNALRSTTQPRPSPNPNPNPNAPKLPEHVAVLTGNRLNLHNRILKLIRENDLQEAVLLTRHSVYSNCKPTIFTCNAVMTACLRQSKYAELLNLHRFITQAAIAANVVTYNLVINTYMDCRKTDTALEHYKQLIEGAPFDPNTTTYRIVIKGLVDDNKLEKALEIKDEMLSKGFEPDPMVYSYLMSGHAKNGNHDGIFELYDELKGKLGGFVSNGVVYGSVMKGYFMRGMEKEAMECFGGGFAEKLNLNKMIEELDLPDVPSVFICPISLEPMEDPVTLCTGQTYERSNILKWFNLGHFTCPTTMQELWDDSVTPNMTLHQLIHTWFAQKYIQMKKKSEDVIGNAVEVLETLKKVKGQARVQSLKELRLIVTNHATARTAVVEKGGVSVLTSLLGPYTSHTIGSEVVSILVNLSLDSSSRLNLMQPAKVSLVVDMLNEGSIQTKINCTKLIQTLMEEDNFDIQIISSHSLLVGLMRLVRDRRHPIGNLPGLKLLKSICWHKQVRILIVKIGAVPQLVELLPTMTPECLELTLFVLDAVSTVKEGNLALSSCSNTIPNMVRVLMRVSESCTQLALSILWSICKLSPEEYSSVAVDVGLAGKLLLVIQSGCDPLLKQRSAELLKLCSLNYTDSIFISKCKLTQTIR